MQLVALTASVSCCNASGHASWPSAASTGNFAYAGIDMALWGLCGKACGQQLYRLFGGALRDTVDYFYYVVRGDEAEIAERVRRETIVLMDPRLVLH